MRDELPKVELHPAHIWTCDNCGRDNFERCIVGELPDDEREEAYRHFNQLPDYAELPDKWREFELLTPPDVVTCGHCQEKYSTIDQRLDDDED